MTWSKRAKETGQNVAGECILRVVINVWQAGSLFWFGFSKPRAEATGQSVTPRMSRIAGRFNSPAGYLFSSHVLLGAGNVALQLDDDLMLVFASQPTLLQA